MREHDLFALEYVEMIVDRYSKIGAPPEPLARAMLLNATAMLINLMGSERTSSELRQMSNTCNLREQSPIGNA